ncbi:hypothetical protein CCACVL1_25568 [Corchorus capsularis]|uniref:Uncharacterized protein n=1 Tax=Corchorus capsularis TaxID=210143 RepID=A0A1R3GJ72_COCAP|nr:hypothetical protein CCACVL1_25568 [Corchorus capsularis]
MARQEADVEVEGDKRSTPSRGRCKGRG